MAFTIGSTFSKSIAKYMYKSCVECHDKVNESNLLNNFFKKLFDQFYSQKYIYKNKISNLAALKLNIWNKWYAVEEF